MKNFISDWLCRSRSSSENVDPYQNSLFKFYRAYYYTTIVLYAITTSSYGSMLFFKLIKNRSHKETEPKPEPEPET